MDRLAPWYSLFEYAAFGRKLLRARFQFAGELPGAKRILILGEGNGRFLQHLLPIAQSARIDVVDASSGMLHLAQERIGPTNRVRFHHADARTFPFEPCDAVVTNFFRDCFSGEDCQKLAALVSRVLTPGGVWLLSEFQVPKEKWSRLHARVWLSVMYKFLPLPLD